MSKAQEVAIISMINLSLGNLYKIKEQEEIIPRVVLSGEMVQQ
jgi:hypothetical protein